MYWRNHLQSKSSAVKFWALQSLQPAAKFCGASTNVLPWSSQTDIQSSFSVVNCLYMGFTSRARVANNIPTPRGSICMAFLIRQYSRHPFSLDRGAFHVMTCVIRHAVPARWHGNDSIHQHIKYHKLICAVVFGAKVTGLLEDGTAAGLKVTVTWRNLLSLVPPDIFLSSVSNTPGCPQDMDTGHKVFDYCVHLAILYL